jgi:hypothetical protein
MLALIYRDHGDEAINFMETSGTGCHVRYKRRGWKDYQHHTFAIEEAKQAGLIKPGPWTQYPAAMLRARCISAVARMAFPDSIGGMYTPEELGAEVDQDGSVVAHVATVHALPQPEPDDTQPQMESQRKRMWATAREHKWTDDQIHKLLSVEFPAAFDQEKKRGSTLLLNRGEMARLIEMVSTPPPFAEGPVEGEIVGEQPALRIEADE